MTHGTPDWGFTRLVTGHALSEDLAELAARLGSIHVYDRRGYVLWQDDFTRGMGAWWSDTDGLNAAVELSAVGAKWPPYCLKLTGGSNGDQSCQIAEELGPIVRGPCGFEVSVDFDTDFYEYRFSLKLDSSDLYYQPEIKLDDNAGKIYYLNNLGGWTELADLPNLEHTFSGYHSMKLVVDFLSVYYVRFMLDDVSYELPDVPMYTTPTYGNYGLRPKIFFKSRFGQNDYCYVDGVIVTQNE